jgi:hypothetical protein
MKNKQIILKLEETIYESYRNLCKSKGYNMSQRIRNFIEKEILNEKEIN